MNQIATHIADIRTRIARTQAHYQLPIRPVTLVAVSKGQGIEAIEQAIEAGLRVFAENRIQEAQEKWPTLKARYPDISLHLIGALQTNKVKDALELFDIIEVIDRRKLVNILGKTMKQMGRKLPCYLQVNTGEELQKSGVIPSQVEEMLLYCKQQDVPIEGLMCIPPIDEPPALHFGLMAQLAKDHHLSTLSMGMSGDFETALTLGATHIRLGTAIFGARKNYHTTT